MTTGPTAPGGAVSHGWSKTSDGPVIDVSNIGTATVGLAGQAATGAASILNPLSGFTDFLGWLSDPHNVLRIVYVIGGAAAVLVGLRMLATEIGGPIGAVGGAVKSTTDKAASAAKSAATVAAL